MNHCDAYVSLGFNCEIGMQFVRIGYEVSSFFRYTFSPNESTLNLIRNDFRDIYLKENLVPHTDSMVRDVKYNIMFHSPLASALEPMTGQRRYRKDYDFDAVYANDYRKIVYFIDMWNALAGSEKRVVYFMKAEPNSGRAFAERVLATFHEKYPGHRFTIVYLQPESMREPDWSLPGLVNYYLPSFAPIESAHVVDTAAWDRLFAEYPLSPLLFIKGLAEK